MAKAVCYGNSNPPTFEGEYKDVVEKATDWVKRKRQSYNDKNRWKLNQGYDFRNDEMPFGFDIIESFNG